MGSGLIVSSLSRGVTPLHGRDAAQGADTVVLLGGGADTYSANGVVLGLLAPASLLRALEAARVYKVISARLVIVSGGMPFPALQLKPESVMLRDALVDAGVPADRILQDPAARTTYEHPKTVGPILQANHVGRFVLVTSPIHMRRALAVFRAAGLHPVPSPSLLRSENVPAPAWLVPSRESLYLSDQATYEYAAWLYYWTRGWTAEPSRR